MTNPRPHTPLCTSMRKVSLNDNYCICRVILPAPSDLPRRKAVKQAAQA
ncbi:MAG: hypothetical protein HW397_501 [Dehalococcoidia bacterium]|nr:hypothetical protein [Dehalococcoidia bacterium]